MPDFDDGFQPAPLPLASDNQAITEAEQPESWDLIPPPSHAAIAAGVTPHLQGLIRRYGSETLDLLLNSEMGKPPRYVQDRLHLTDAEVRALAQHLRRQFPEATARRGPLPPEVHRQIQHLVRTTYRSIAADRQTQMEALATRYAARMAAQGAAIEVGAAVAQAAAGLGIGAVAGHVAGRPGLTVPQEAALGAGSVAAAAIAGAAIGSVVPGPGTAAGAAIAAAAAALGGGALVMGGEAYLEAEAAAERTAEVERRQQALGQLSPTARRASVRRPGIRGELMISGSHPMLEQPRHSLLTYADTLGLGWLDQLPTLELRDTIAAELQRRWQEQGLGPPDF